MTTFEELNPLTNEAILFEIGQRIAHRRLELRFTQANLAEQSGVAKRTVERIEAGGSTQTVTLIRILRVLDLLGGLDRLIPESKASPMDLLKRKGKIRQRASKARSSEKPNKTWIWDNEK